MNLDDISKLLGTDRRCHNCACFRTLQADAALPERIGICIREPARQSVQNVEVPVLDTQGQIRTFRDGKPMTTTRPSMSFGFPPTHGLLTCMDGWRPAGTEPGAIPEDPDERDDEELRRPM